MYIDILEILEIGIYQLVKMYVYNMSLVELAWR
jgi:hypothetical protein